MADDEISVKNDLTYEPLKERLTGKQDLSFCIIFLETHRILMQIMLCRINQREKDTTLSRLLIFLVLLVGVHRSSYGIE